MPLTKKGEEILGSMRKTYGSEKKAKQVLYASKNAGKIKGVDSEDADDKRVMFLGRMRDALYEGHGLQSALRKATGDTMMALVRDALDAGKSPTRALREAYADVRDYGGFTQPRSTAPKAVTAQPKTPKPVTGVARSRM